MNEETDRRILEELRNLNAQIKKANKANVVALSILGLFVALFLISIPLRHRLYSHAQSTSHTTDSWREARSLLDQEDTQKAKEMIERLLQKYPDYYYGHTLMGSVQQELGNLEAAEKSYARAVELFPEDENEKVLAAIRKAIQKKKSANKTSEPSVAPAPQP